MIKIGTIFLLGIFMISANPKAILGMEKAGDLGVIESAELNPAIVGIKECGLSTSVKQKWTYAEVKTKGNSLVFPDSTREIIWFAQFGLRGSMKNNMSRSYRIQWIAPDGSIFLDEKFKSSLWNETFVKKSIQFEIPIKEQSIGQWRVRVWKKDQLIDDRYFEILKT